MGKERGAVGQFHSDSKLSLMWYDEASSTGYSQDGPAVADVINPSHYRSHPSGVECIQITEHMNFNLGNATKYIWRAGNKGDAIEDLNKARWYIDREISRLEGSA